MNLAYKVLDKSIKMEEEEFEKFLFDTFQNDGSAQGIIKLKEAKDIDEVLKRFDIIPDEFYDYEESTTDR